ncbi:MAG TPA: tRNA dihydrouridine(20/20a) synthase DusA [Gammaproteobacteria bacterium]
MAVSVEQLSRQYSPAIDRRFCIAPMMDWTDRHCRFWFRLIFPQTLLYTEMITTDALLYGDRRRLLAYDASEHPVALQLGGGEPGSMAVCARMAEDWGYDEVNINVGCPSDRVQSGSFGACLMAEPDRVAACVEAMRAAVDIPVTVKTRIGIDELDDYEHLRHFVLTVASAGCETFIIHARKAWLSGLSPKENREIPPLDYPRVYRLKRDFPALSIVINGGIKTVDDIMAQLHYVDGVMVGREAYQNPYALIGLRADLYGEQGGLPGRKAVVDQYLSYMRGQVAQGVYLKHMTRHILGIFQGVPGAKRWRRYLSENACRPGAGVDVVEAALEQVSQFKNVTEGVSSES